MAIEVTVISAEVLRLGINIFVKKDVFVVRSDTFNSRSTGTDREGGSYPTWNEKLVELPNRKSAIFKFMLKGANGGKNGIVNLSVRVLSPGQGEPWSGVPMIDGKAIARGIPISHKY
ncbi:uncharacterized protein LOC125221383 [Salvia hispanica]|uniref:uncharacterized protein LOC125221383 n=1 Tax=Salvia hispanica TaxID=49212 RepID=UPI00200950C8|nr:uncharacterized protein LOC125221383 [Salvia hispanica]